MVKPIKIDNQKTPNHGRFGFKRKHDIHTGFDIYCNDGEPVYSIQNGIVVNICHFTGEKAKLPWWEDTEAILIESEVGTILYGEVYKTNLKIGDKVKEGQKISTVKRVLKKDKGLPTTMLHIELYKHGYVDDGVIWELNAPKPKYLLNIESLLFNIYGLTNLI